MTESIRPENSAATSGAAPGQTTPTSQSPAGKASPGPIPYDRFKEVNDSKNALQEEVGRLRGQLGQMQHQQAQIISQAQQAVQMAQQANQPRPPQVANPAIDPEEIALNKLLGEDDAGKEARRVLDVYSAYQAKKNGFVSRADMESLLREVQAQTEARIMGTLNTTFNVTNRFQRMVTTGMISPEQAHQLQGHLNQIIAQNPQIKTQPHNVDYLASHLLTTAIEAGHIRPYSTPAKVNPLQPSGGGYTPDMPDPTAPINTDVIKFPSLRNKGVDRLRELTERSINAHKGATS